jgi:hypothetical protein
VESWKLEVGSLRSAYGLRSPTFGWPLFGPYSAPIRTRFRESRSGFVAACGAIFGSSGVCTVVWEEGAREGPPYPDWPPSLTLLSSAMVKSRFWRMQEPEYRSDYQSSFVNGGLEHPFGVPGVHCEICRATWGGCRVLPYPCPEPLRERQELLERWPIAGPAHRLLRSEIAECLRVEGYEASVLLPGDSLQPNYLDVPSRPRADFLWASLGSVVVSERIRVFFSELAADAVTFTPDWRRR